MPGQPGLNDEAETDSFGSPFFMAVRHVTQAMILIKACPACTFTRQTPV
jgi:hypothetical protein